MRAGVIVSYFEWVQNVSIEQWDAEDATRKLEQKMKRATDAVIDKQRELGRRPVRPRRVAGSNGQPHPYDSEQPLDFRTAAYVLALSRITQTAIQRGIWP